MPKIYRRSDGGYYTKTKVENSFITYQIKPKGIEILKAYGFVEDEVFDHETLLRLLNDGYAYTDKSGPSTLFDDETIALDPKRKKNPDVFHYEFKLGWIMSSGQEYIKVLFETKEGFYIKQFKTKDFDNWVVDITKFNKHRSRIHKILAEFTSQRKERSQKEYREMGHDAKICQRIGENAKDLEDRIEYSILSLFFIEKELEKEFYGKFGALLAVVENNGFNVKKAKKQLRKIAQVDLVSQSRSEGSISETKLKEDADEIIKLTTSLILKAGYHLS